MVGGETGVTGGNTMTGVTGGNTMTGSGRYDWRYDYDW